MRILATCLVLLGSVSAMADPPPPTFRVIVHPRNPVVTVDRKFLVDAFLKKRTRWADDAAIRPADLPPRSPIRASFSQRVLNRSVDAVKSYWQQIIFSGRGVPPPELIETDVIDFVLRHEGAIGYVSGDVDLRGAKVVQVK